MRFALFPSFWCDVAIAVAWLVIRKLCAFLSFLASSTRDRLSASTAFGGQSNHLSSAGMFDLVQIVPTVKWPWDDERIWPQWGGRKDEKCRWCFRRRSPPLVMRWPLKCECPVFHHLLLTSNISIWVELFSQRNTMERKFYMGTKDGRQRPVQCASLALFCARKRRLLTATNYAWKRCQLQHQLHRRQQWKKKMR